MKLSAFSFPKSPRRIAQQQQLTRRDFKIIILGGTLKQWQLPKRITCTNNILYYFNIIKTPVLVKQALPCIF